VNFNLGFCNQRLILELKNERAEIFITIEKQDIYEFDMTYVRT
jgi:hypothetical protein